MIIEVVVPLSGHCRRSGSSRTSSAVKLAGYSAWCVVCWICGSARCTAFSPSFKRNPASFTFAAVSVRTWRISSSSAGLSGPSSKPRAAITATGSFAVDGIKPQALSGNTEWNKSAEEYFAQWAAQCEVSKRFCFAECQALVCRGMDVDGEYFVHKTRNRDGALRLQLIESHRIGDADQNDTEDGIGFDEFGAPALYRVLRAIESAAPACIPHGLGKLTSVMLTREVCDWRRFNNRRQVSSDTGLCPGEYSSGGKRVQGSVTKHGNPRLRAALVELAWRLVRFQPQYPPVAKRLCILGKGARHRRRTQEGHRRRGAAARRGPVAAAHRALHRRAARPALRRRRGKRRSRTRHGGDHRERLLIQGGNLARRHPTPLATCHSPLVTSHH
ncbi:MAG: phage portal protein [Chthoniobacteraceae bacterium]